MNFLKNKINIFIILLFISTGCSIYSNILDVPFIFDDGEYVNDPTLHMESLSLESILKALKGGEAKRRPVSNLSIAINYLINKSNVQGYHAFNIAIHISAAIILYLLVQLTLALPSVRQKYKNYTLIAFFTAAIWLVHPLATQSVTYIIQRMNSMAAMFYLLSVLLYAKARLNQQHQVISPKYFTPYIWLFAGSFLSALLAIGSKEIAVTLPIILFLYEWYFFQNLRRNWILDKIPWLFCVFIAVLIWLFVYLGKNPAASIMHSCDNRSFTSIERLLTELRVVVHYLGLILYPAPNRLIFDYDYPVSTSLLTPVTTLFSLLTLSSLAAAALFLAKKERLLSFCIAWFLINLVIESSVICLELVYEHRTYLPSTFILLGIISLLFRSTSRQIVISLLLLPVIILLAYWTIERNRVWQDPEIFWADALKKAPNKPRILSNIGNLYFHKQEYDKAEENYLKALSLGSKDMRIMGNLITTYLKTEQLEKAEHYLGIALSLEPEWVAMMNNLASLHIKRKEYGNAVSRLRAALFLAPRSPQLNQNMGHVLLRTGRPKLAVFFLEQAAAYRPDNIGLQLELAEAFMTGGQHEEAIKEYTHILALDPNSAIAHYNLALLLTGTNDEQARFHYEESVQLSPYSVPALYNLANMLFKSGELAKAKEYYQRILEITSEFANTNNNYGLLLIGEGKYQEAASFFEQALRIKPDFDLARSNLIMARKQIGLEESQSN